MEVSVRTHTHTYTHTHTHTYAHTHTFWHSFLCVVCLHVCLGGLLSTPTGSTTWQGATPLVGFGHMTSRSLVQPTASSASQWPDVFGDSPLQPGGFGKKTSESESKKQTSETSKGVWEGGWGVWGRVCVLCVFTQYFKKYFRRIIYSSASCSRTVAYAYTSLIMYSLHILVCESRQSVMYSRYV